MRHLKGAAAAATDCKTFVGALELAIQKEASNRASMSEGGSGAVADAEN